MSVNNDDNKFLEDCSTVTEHEFSFKIFKDTDLIVSLVDNDTQEEIRVLELNKDYEVEISRIEDGGKVILTKAYPGQSVYGIRKLTISQPEQIPTEGHFPESTIEDALDRSCMISQQLKEEINRAIKIPGSSGFSGVNVDLPVPKAENVLAWNKNAKALVNYDVKKEIADFENGVNSAMTNFESSVNATLSETKKEFATQISTFENEVNTKITVVSEAAEKINEMEEAVQTAIEKADTATQRAADADVSAQEAAKQADNAAQTASEMTAKYASIEAFKNSFPAAVNLTTWARLNDGAIYNVPFDDVKADSNRFILFENTNDRRTLRFKKNTFIRLETETNTRHFVLWDDMVINVEEYLDDGTALTNGKDYSIFLVPEGADSIAIKISLNKTAPTNYDTVNTRRIGGFHTMCADVGTVTANNAMNGWLAGDIIPNSVWTLWHKPVVASPSGARYVPERDGWRTIYFQSQTGANTCFEYGGTITRSRTAWDHERDLGEVGWEFETSIDFTMSEQGIVPLKAVNGKAESSCTKAGGWKNENLVRMVTNGGDESCCGGLWEILAEYGPCGGSGWANSGTANYTDAKQYGSIQRLVGGGGWDNSGYAGPSCRIGTDSALGVHATVGARGWSRPLRARQ